MANIQENLSLPGMETPHIAFVKLRPVHEKFCQEYAKHGIGVKAYLSIYPDTDNGTARNMASKWLRKETIQQRLAELALEIDRELKAAVSGYHLQVMQQDRAEYLHDDGRPKKLHEMTEEQRRIVDLETKVVDGFIHYLPVFGTRKQSAEAIAKIKGMVADKLELTGKDGGPIDSNFNVTFYIPSNERD